MNWNGQLLIPSLPSISFPPSFPMCPYAPICAHLRLFFHNRACVYLQVLIGGSSAGGLALLTHCDYLRSNLPSPASLKCLSEAGVFVDMYGCHWKPLGLNHAQTSLYEMCTTILSVYKDLRYGYSRRCVRYHQNLLWSLSHMIWLQIFGECLPHLSLPLNLAN